MQWQRLFASRLNPLPLSSQKAHTVLSGGDERTCNKNARLGLGVSVFIDLC